MKIENLRQENKGNRAKIAATVIWENCDRPNQELYFETTQEFAADVFCNPNAFITACTIPAMRYGEKRIAIDSPICPQLKDGLTTVMHSLVEWYGGDRRVIPIEAPLESQISSPQNSRAGCFFSGGIDAISMLRTNRLNYPLEHPRSIKDGILVYGILKGEDENEPSFQYVLDGVSKMAEDAKINIIPVYTNAYAHIRDLDPDFSFWKGEFHGSFLAAIAHIFAQRLTTVSIASTFDLANLIPWGSHPLIDPHFSSNNLHIRHEDVALSRLEKTKLVAEWDVALKNLRVCNEKDSYRYGNHNCGKCEKCLRTMTTLLALGVLDKTATFPQKDISEDLLTKGAYIDSSYQEVCYRSLIPLLMKLKRYDIVDGISRIITRYHERDLKGMIKRFDRNFLRGSLLNLGKKLIA
jgi:hypothetical protein